MFPLSLSNLQDFVGDAMAAQQSSSGIPDPSPYPSPSSSSSSSSSSPSSSSAAVASTSSPGMSRPARYLFVLLPPLTFALLKPDIFLSALDYAGTYGVMSLFGVLPVVLAWKQRYGSGEGTVEEARRMQVAVVELLPGGQPVLLATGLAASAVIINQAHLHLDQLLHAI
jgi:hypothetical protein